MSLTEYESSIEGSRPVELYVFTIGVTTTYRYTSSESDEVIDGNTYQSISISRDESEEGPVSRDGIFTVELPSDDVFARQYINIIPGARVRLDVIRYQRDDTPTPELFTIFSGFVEGVELAEDGNVAKVSARSAIAALRRTIPRLGFQSQCNHVLYSVDCGVNESDPAFRVLAAPVAAINGTSLEVSGLSLFSDDWFTGGFVASPSAADYRQILSHTGNVIVLDLPFLTPPTTVDVYAGCPHTIQACKSKFDNVINYGGFAFVPNRNPFADGL